MREWPEEMPGAEVLFRASWPRTMGSPRDRDLSLLLVRPSSSTFSATLALIYFLCFITIMLFFTSNILGVGNMSSRRSIMPCPNELII